MPAGKHFTVYFELRRNGQPAGSISTAKCIRCLDPGCPGQSAGSPPRCVTMLQAKRVRFSAKDRFAETRELIAGYWHWKVKDMDEAAAH